MRYRVLGSTGMRVSAIGLGTWQFGGEWGRTFSQADADAILVKAAELGINLIDTAECYGDRTSESLIGDYLSRHDRARWIVATKFGHGFTGFMDRTEDFSTAGVLRQLEGSLHALRVEAIDLYQFHSGSDSQFLNDELWAMLAAQKQAGKIRHLGISIMGKGSQMQTQAARRVGAEALQVIYSRLDRRAEQLYFPQARQANLGILARVPLACGFLSGKYGPDAAFPANDRRSALEAKRMRADLVEVERLRQSEVPKGVPMAQWALAWCLKAPAVSAVIPRCRGAGCPPPERKIAA